MNFCEIIHPFKLYYVFKCLAKAEFSSERKKEKEKKNPKWFPQSKYLKNKDLNHF